MFYQSTYFFADTCYTLLNIKYKGVRSMIEIIYKGEDEERHQEIDVKLPKNVRQIGNCEHEINKIYVEDFVMAYVKRFGNRKLKYGVLLGNIKRGNGNVYMFITGAVCAKPVLDNEIVFDDDVWTGLYEDVKTYFDEVEIVGWFASMPGILDNDMPQLQKLHLDNFAGNDRVCFLIDQIEGEDAFYMYDEGGMKNCGGYYIYYEKNADMQSYMVLNQDESEIPEDYEQSRKRSINTRVHRLLFQQESEPERPQPLVEYKVPLEEKSGSGIIKRRKLPTFAYSASSFMLLAILLVTVAFMNASGQLKDLKNAVSNIGKSDDGKETPKENPKVVDVAGGVEPTSENKQGDGSKASSENNSEQKKDTGNNTEVNSDGTTKSEETTKKEETTKVEETSKKEETSSIPEASTTQEPTTDKATVAAREQQIYTVKAGDSLYSISLKNYGTTEMIEKIKEANGISNGDLIKEGQRIVLP